MYVHLSQHSSLVTAQSSRSCWLKMSHFDKEMVSWCETTSLGSTGYTGLYNSAGKSPSRTTDIWTANLVVRKKGEAPKSVDRGTGDRRKGNNGGFESGCSVLLMVYPVSSHAYLGRCGCVNLMEDESSVSESTGVRDDALAASGPACEDHWWSAGAWT